MLYVEFADAVTVALNWLRPRLVPDWHGYAGSEPPGPDEFAAVTPVLVVTALTPPPMINRYALAPARLYFETIAPDQETANRSAAKANAWVRAMGGQTIQTLDGATTVSTVRRCTLPESDDDANPGYRTAAFPAELYLRPVRAHT